MSFYIKISHSVGEMKCRELERVTRFCQIKESFIMELNQSQISQFYFSVRTVLKNISTLN